MIDHKPLRVHGSQVALAALAGAQMYQRFLAEFEPSELNIDACYPSMDALKTRIESNLQDRSFG